MNYYDLAARRRAIIEGEKRTNSHAMWFVLLFLFVLLIAGVLAWANAQKVAAQNQDAQDQMKADQEWQHILEQHK